MNKSIVKEIAYYTAAIFLCLGFLYWVMHLWSADLMIPFQYMEDVLPEGIFIKGTIDNGWYMTNPFIGMPWGFNSYDFPNNRVLDFSIMKMISLVFPNWALTLNIYFLLTFPLTVITTLFVLRKLKISPLPAIVGSLLFAFIPYHFFRGEAHLSLAAYFLIPLIVLVIFWIFEDDFLLNQFKKASIKSLLPVLNWKNLFSIVICIGIGSTFVYYPFFSCVFLLVAGVCAAISREKWIPLLNSLILIGVILLCVFASNIPTLLYQYSNGIGQYILTARPPQDSEIYGLKIIQLLLPIIGHRIPLFAHIADVYYRTAPLVNENHISALGIIGSLGFITLIIWIFYKLFTKYSISRNETLIKLNQISALNLAAVLLATIGGFGTIVAYVALPQLRCYNRISVFIAFFSILTVMLLLDLLIQKYSFSKIKKWIIYGGIGSILFFGIYDQTSATNVSFVPDYNNTKEEFLQDKRFINNIETSFPDVTMVFQLPYAALGAGPPAGIGQYAHFRAYLHSTKIHWSYGQFWGRDGDLWQRAITSKPTGEMIQDLSFAGFDGIYVDIYGYKGREKEVISSISSILNVTPLVSDNGRLYFFDMTQYNSHLKAQFTSDEFEKQYNKILTSLRVDWQDGFSTLEGTPENNWRWCSATGTMVVNNPTDKDRKCKIKATYSTGYPELSNLKIESGLIAENLKINSSGYYYKKEVIIPPGIHVIKFSCDAKRVDAPGDPRYLVFAMRNFQIIESE